MKPYHVKLTKINGKLYYKEKYDNDWNACSFDQLQEFIKDIDKTYIEFV